MKQKYEIPLMEVINLEAEDIIITSNNGFDNGDDGFDMNTVLDLFSNDFIPN